MAAEAQRAPLVRERRSFAARISAAWDEIAPQFTYHYDAGQTERWDGKGVGPGRHLGFEGFGASVSIFFGRMPAICQSGESEPPRSAAAVPGNDHSAWAIQMAAYEMALAAANSAGWEEAESEAETAAWFTLMKTPAPDAAALHWKLNYLFGKSGVLPERQYCDAWSREVMDFVLADSARLATGGAA